MPNSTKKDVSLLGQNEETSCAEAEPLELVFRDVIRQSPISTWIAEQNGVLIFENAANRRLFGIDSDDQVVGKYNLFEDQILIEQGLLPEIRKVFDKGEELEFTIDYDFSKVNLVDVPRATHRYLRVFIFPVKGASGQVQYAVIQHEDITEKRRTEEAMQLFRYAAESSVDGIVLTDAEGMIVYINPSCAAMHGYKPEEMEAQHASILCEGTSLVAEILSDAMKSGRWVGEMACRRKDGTTFIMECRLSTINLPSLKTPGVLIICRDITAEKQSEEARKQMEHHLKEQQRQFFKQTIKAATGGKLMILEPEEMEKINGNIIEEFGIRKQSDVTKARHGIESTAISIGMSRKKAENLALCAGEAGTNALKHAGGGVVSFLAGENSILVKVADSGPGMDALILPRATLELGYSTGHSLGMGYAVILALSDEVFLTTGPAGTTVVIGMNMEPTPYWSAVEALPDTW